VFCKSNFHLIVILSCIFLLAACAAKTSNDVENGDGDGNTEDLINNIPNVTCDKSDANFELQSGINNPITEDTTIGPGCYYTSQSVFIDNGAQLTILPNTILQFAPLTGLIIENGNVFAIGNATNPIYFTSDTIIKNQNNAWIGIDIRERSSKFRANRFKFTIIEHAGSVQDLTASGALATTASIRVNDSTKYNSPVTDKPRILFSHNIIRDGVGDYGLFAAKGSYFELIGNNIFYNNRNHPISIDVNESFRVDDSNSFNFNGQSNGDNKILITGSKLNILKFYEAQTPNQKFDENSSRDITWTKISIPYEIEEDILISSTNLIIEAGVSVLFNPTSGLSINTDSTLTSIGTSLQPITMNSISLIQNSNWLGIIFENSNGNNTIEYTNINNAGAKEDSNFQISESSIIVAANSIVKIRNSKITNSDGFGLYVDATSTLIDFENNSLLDNTLGIAEVSPLILSQLLPNNTYGNGIGNTLEDTIFVLGDQLIENGNYRFFNLGVPYVFESHLSVQGDLFIEAGTVLLFEADRFVTVDQIGSLNAVGSSNQRILFSSISQYMQASNTDKYWNGILFFRSNDKINNVFDYVDIEYAGEPRNANFAVLGLSNGATLTVTNSSISNTSPRNTTATVVDENSVLVRDQTNVNIIPNAQ